MNTEKEQGTLIVRKEETQAPGPEFPTLPDEDGFYYNSDQDKTMDILTKDYDNGTKIKKVKLLSGKSAIVRMLRGRDFVKTKSMLEAYKNTEVDFETINMSLAVKIDESTFPPEYYMDDMYQVDFSKIYTAFNTINFQLG